MWSVDIFGGRTKKKPIPWLSWFSISGSMTALRRYSFGHFYPKALKSCQGIVFTMVSGWAGGEKKFVWPVSQRP